VTWSSGVAVSLRIAVLLLQVPLLTCDCDTFVARYSHTSTFFPVVSLFHNGITYSENFNSILIMLHVLFCIGTQFTALKFASWDHVFCLSGPCLCVEST
jgi:hypothetical protein